jgi:hypothetical protein
VNDGISYLGMISLQSGAVIRHRSQRNALSETVESHGAGTSVAPNRLRA